MTLWVLSGQSNRPAGGARLWGSRSFGPETTFSCRWVRILSITAGSWMQAIALTAPPQALDVEIQRTPQTLDQRHRARVSGLFCKTRLFDQMRGDDAVDNPQHFTHYAWAAGEQETQWIRETQHPLAHRLRGKDRIHQQCGTFRHTPCPAAGANTSPLTTERHQAFRVAGFATRVRPNPTAPNYLGLSNPLAKQSKTFGNFHTNGVAAGRNLKGQIAVTGRCHTTADQPVYCTSIREAGAGQRWLNEGVERKS